MVTHETVSHNLLSIQLIETDEEVRLVWRGKSNDRLPHLVLVPLLTRALELSERGRREVVMEFGGMEYMNSSTITCLVRILDQAARGPYRVRLEYSQARNWQALSFSALKAFETPDGRVSVHAL